MLTKNVWWFAIFAQIKIQQKPIFSHNLCSVPGRASIETIEKGFETCSFIKKRLQNMRFSLKFTKLLRASILKNISERFEI